MSKNNNSISRKEAIKRLGGLSFGLPLMSSTFHHTIGGQKINEPEELKSSGRGKTKKTKPNILFLIDDQHRGDFLGFAGAKWLSTPNLDKLAQEGVVFPKAYSSVPSCTPARTSILTGLSPWNHGMLGYMRSINQYYRCTMPQFFAERGYDTVAMGKNHFGPPRNSNGYLTVKLEESFYSHGEHGFLCDYQSWFHRVAPGLNLNATGLGYNDHRGGIAYKFKDTLHATYWTAEKGIEFLRRGNNNSPWLLKISFQRPHPPFDPPKRWIDYYLNKGGIPAPKVGEWAKRKYAGKEGNLNENPNVSSGIFPADEIMLSRATYAGSISFIDEQVGRIIVALKETGEYENTLILFTSDHGDMMGDQYMWRKCRAYEPSSNIPMILRLPESLGIEYERGSSVDALVELRDIFPTFVDVCNFDVPVGIDGKSMLKVIKKEGTWRNILDLEHSKVYEPDNAWVALTDGRYKYIYFTLTGEEQLFDLKNDPHELDNIVYNDEKLHQEWYDKMVKHLVIRGPKWVKNDKLQIQNSSDLVGKNFPEQYFNEGYY